MTRNLGRFIHFSVHTKETAVQLGLTGAWQSGSSTVIMRSPPSIKERAHLKIEVLVELINKPLALFSLERK